MTLGRLVFESNSPLASKSHPSITFRKLDVSLKQFARVRIENNRSDVGLESHYLGDTCRLDHDGVSQ